jgi:hypothetical protein
MFGPVNDKIKKTRNNVVARVAENKEEKKKVQFKKKIENAFSQVPLDFLNDFSSSDYEPEYQDETPSYRKQLKRVNSK